MLCVSFLLLISISIQIIRDPPDIKDELTIIAKRLENNEDSDYNQNNMQSSDMQSASTDDDYSEINNEQNNNEQNFLNLPELPQDLQNAETEEYIDFLKKKLNKSLGLDDDEITSFLNTDFWKKFYDYIELNLKDFMIDGKLSIQLHIRYFLCCYIVAFIPGQFVFFYPSIWIKLVPKKVLKLDFFRKAYNALRTFQDFVKKTGKKKFIITFYFGRYNTLLEDLKFMTRIPNMIKNDISGLIDEIFKFEIRSEGYEDYKKNNKKNYFSSNT